MTNAPAGTVARSALIRQKLAFARTHSRRGRTARFQARTLAMPDPAADPDFDIIAALPDWLLLSAPEEALLAMCVAVAAHRPAIDRELSGAKLAALAEIVGEARFDLLCDLDDLPQANDPRYSQLPRPEDLAGIGAAIITQTAQTPAAHAADALYAHQLCSKVFGQREHLW